MINSPGIGGAERVLVDDINECVRRGTVEVRLLTLRPESEKSFSGQLSLQRNYWKVVQLKKLFAIWGVIQILLYIYREKPDLIVSHLWYANTVAKICKLFGACRTVLTFEQNVYDTIKSKKSFLLDRVLQRFCTKIIAVSSTVRDSLIAHGIDQQHIQVIYNSVDVETFSKPHHLIEPLPHPKGTFTFLYIGRLIPQKNVEHLLRAFVEVEGAVLYIVGTGYLQEKLEALVAQLGIAHRVYFLGVRSDIPALMQACDCFVFPSLYEGFSLVLLEAMASQMPIIISDFAAGREVIVDNGNGIIAGPTATAFADACRCVMQDESLRHQIAKEARKTAQTFSISRHVDEILAFIK